MTEETVDFIEDTNDEVENWIYYDNEAKDDTNSEINIFNDGTETQLIYADHPELVGNVDDYRQFQYEDELVNDIGVDEQITLDVMDQVNEKIVEDDLSKHTLILRETINDSGQLVEGYICHECNIPFDTIEAFLQSHPCTELFNEFSEQLNTQTMQEELIQSQQEPVPQDEPAQQDEPAPQEVPAPQEEPAPQETTQQMPAQLEPPQDKLWDLVENLETTEDEDNIDDDEAEAEEDDIMEIKPNIKTTDATKEGNEDSANAVDLDSERYFCYECQQVFTDLSTAEQHDCSNDIETTNDLVEEESSSLLIESSNISVLRCELCDKDYSSISSYNNHQRWHKRSEILLGQSKTLQKVAAICGICNTIFATEKNLKLHMKMHKKHTLKTIQDALPVGAQNEYNGLDQFFCEICNKSFDQKLIVIHKNMHQNVEEYNCSKCNKQFENLPSYEIHQQMHSSETFVKKLSPSKILNDLIIDTEAPSTSSNVGGAAGGNGEKRKHPCQYCGKEFQRPYEKVKHERIHTGEKPYECEVCGKTFRVSYSLTLHLRTHTDIRPYVCATCNKRFKQQSVYVHHMKTHANERSYKCDVCNKSFRTSVQLSGHRNSHSKPFNCTECNRPFASMYAVKIHMKTHNKTHKANKNLKNRCNICGASYARQFALRFHLKEQHGIDIDPSQLLLNSENIVASTSAGKDMDIETAILMNAANEATSNHDHNQQIMFINDVDVENEEDIAASGIGGNDVGKEIQVDHEENIAPSLSHSIYLDETEAATQTILNTEEIIVDNFHAEEIITDWLSSN